MKRITLKYAMLILCSVVLASHATPVRILWDVIQPNLQFRSCSFGSNYVVSASSTDIGHKSNIQVHTHDGKPVWTQSFDSVSGPAQVATSNKNFGTIIPYLQPVSNLWNYYNNTPVTAWPLPSPPSPSRSIIFSQDGSKLFYTLNNGDQTKIFWKDVSGKESNWSSGTPGTPPLSAATTRAGEVVAVVMKGKFAVIDTALARPVYQEDTAYSSSTGAIVLCVSDTARYIAYGTGTTVTLHSFHDWNKHVYTWEYSEPEMAIQSCAIGDSNLVLTFYSAGYNMQTKVIVFQLHNHHEPAWFWKSPLGNPNNYPSHTSITNDGAFFAISSWGTIYGNTPQITIWSTQNSEPIATFIGKGSLYDVQLSYKSDHNLFDTTDSSEDIGGHKNIKRRSPSDLLVLACGKVGHKTVYGSNGQMYFLDLDLSL